MTPVRKPRAERRRTHRMSNVAGAARKIPTWPSARWTPTGCRISVESGVATRSETAHALRHDHRHANRAAEAIIQARNTSVANVQSSSPVNAPTHVSGQNSHSAAGGYTKYSSEVMSGGYRIPPCRAASTSRIRKVRSLNPAS